MRTPRSLGSWAFSPRAMLDLRCSGSDAPTSPTNAHHPVDNAWTATRTPSPAGGFLHRRVLVIPESRAERLLTPAKRLLAGEREIMRQQGSRALALLTQCGRPCSRRYRRPPSCAGDRAFRIGIKMDESRLCFRIVLEYRVNLAWMGGISSSSETRRPAFIRRVRGGSAGQRAEARGSATGVAPIPGAGRGRDRSRVSCRGSAAG
jgi:hypothetical protein